MPHLHRRRDQTLKRPKRKDPHQTHRWHQYSRNYLKQPENRLCKMCKDEGIVKLSECVDHVIPISKGGDMWWPGNHQPLCNSHHSRKTANENKGWNQQSQ